MRSTAIAHPTQSIVRYDWLLRDPDLPSNGNISAAIESLSTVTTVAHSVCDKVFINGEAVENSRAMAIVNRFRKLYGLDYKIAVYSENMGPNGRITYADAKGLGFSTSSGASLVTALLNLFEVRTVLDNAENYADAIAALTGSGVKSALGGLAYWSAVNGNTKAYVLADKKQMKDFRILCIPLAAIPPITTEEIHEEMRSSQLSSRRQEAVGTYLEMAVDFAVNGNAEGVAYISERDSLLFHEALMQGPRQISVLAPESLAVHRKILELRKGHTDLKKVKDAAGIPAYVSWSGGPTTYVNFRAGLEDEILGHLSGPTKETAILSGLGGSCRATDSHLA